MGLYKPKATLRELFRADPDLFLTFHLPTGLGIDQLVPIMMVELGDLDTLFQTPSEWIAYVSVWSANRAANNWQLMMDALTAQYDPLHNYDMLEQMTNDQTVTQHGKTVTRTDNLSHAKTGTEGDSMSATETPGVTETTEAGIYGLNSAEAVNADRAVTSRAGQDSRSGSSTRTYNTTDAETGTQTLANSGQDTETRNYRLTRSGNIGVTTSQQMLEAEMQLRQRYEIIDIILTDCKRDLFAAVW